MPDDIFNRLDGAMTLIRTAGAVPEEARSGVYKAVKALLADTEKALDALITVAGPAAEDDE